MKARINDGCISIIASLTESHKLRMLGRFLERINYSPTGCWEWSTIFRKDGRGMLGDYKSDGRSTSILAYRFAYEVFNGPIKNSFHVCHRCDNPKCVNPEHLFIGTNADNRRDAKEKNRLRGPQKLTEGQVREIRQLYVRGYHSLTMLARMFSVSIRTVHKIVRFKTWRWIIPNDSEMSLAVRICRKLSVPQVAEIRRRYLNDERPTDLARHFNVTASRIVQIGKHK